MVINAYLNALPEHEAQNDPLGRGAKARALPKEWIDSTAYPVMTYTDGGTVRQEAIEADDGSRTVQLQYLADEALAERLSDLLKGGGCAGVIVNTVQRAQEFARVLRARFGGEAVTLLHSRFLSPDRIEKEKTLLCELGITEEDRQRPDLRIVVGTQVLEQSLDIDFDVLVTDICPMDLMLQRIGRLHRHNRKGRPTGLTNAFCFVMGVEGDRFQEGARAVYGDFLLMRTKALLPSEMVLPRCIPALVQKTYDVSYSISDSASYRKAEAEWKHRIQDKEKRANDFRVSRPWKGQDETIVGWLSTDVSASDARCEAAVRDAADSVEVLLIQRLADGTLHFLPWIELGRELPQRSAPNDTLARLLARQSVRLPPALCAPWNIKKTIQELETLNAEQLSAWQSSDWLKGSLFLVLDERCMASLCGYLLAYVQYDGLLLEKEDDVNG